MEATKQITIAMNQEKITIKLLYFSEVTNSLRYPVTSSIREFTVFLRDSLIFSFTKKKTVPKID